MKGLFLVLVIVLIVISYNYKSLMNKVKKNFIYVIGVYQYNTIDKKMASTIINLANEKNINIIVKQYTSYFTLLNDCNNYKIDFAILPEDFFIDSCLGLNHYKNINKKNNQYAIGLYYNYIYLLSDVFNINNNEEEEINSIIDINRIDTSINKITKLSDIKFFKKKYKRNYILGTESKESYSFLNLIFILSMYGLNGIDFSNYDEKIEYNDNDIFFINTSKRELHKKYLNKKIDGIFVMDIQNSRFVSKIAKTSDVIFLNIDLENTVFDSLFSNYYLKKQLQINDLYNSDSDNYFSKNNVTPKDMISYYNNNDLDIKSFNNKEVSNITNNIGSFNTRGIRSILIANDSVDKKIVYSVTELILRNNNFIINKVFYNKFSNTEHNTFQPIDIIYVDKNIRYHEGSRKLFEEMKFIITDPKELKKMNVDTAEKFDYYWKYSKIGLNNFTFAEDNL